MGRDLSVAVEYYDHNDHQWHTLSTAGIERKQLIKFDKEKEFAALLEEYNEKNSNSEDAVGEAMSELTEYYTLTVGRDYDLFDLLAGMGNEDGRIILKSGCLRQVALWIVAFHTNILTIPAYHS